MGLGAAIESLERLQEQTGGQITDGVVGTFVRERVYNDMLSAGAGEPVYVLHDYCNIRVPGNARANHKALVRKIYPEQGAEPAREVVVEDHWTTTFPRAWDAFLRGEDLRPPGTPIEDCAAIPRERVVGLKQAQIRTVEELINLPDASLRRVGHDARALQRAAREWLDEKAAPAQLAAKVAELEKQLAALKGAGDGHDQDAPAERRSKRGDSAA